jgi:hypothetical protein
VVTAALVMFFLEVKLEQPVTHAPQSDTTLAATEGSLHELKVSINKKTITQIPS